MMQATDLRNRHDLSNRLDRSGIWRILFQGQMTSRIEVVADVSFQRPSQMPLSKNDHVIETLSANATNEPFRKWILPWTSCCGEHLVNAHSLNPVPEMATVNSVTVPNQISRHNIFGECFDDLLRGPFCRGMLRHIEMQHAATLMCEDHEYKEDSQLQGGNRKDRWRPTDRYGYSEKSSRFGMVLCVAAASSARPYAPRFQSRV